MNLFQRKSFLLLQLSSASYILHQFYGRIPLLIASISRGGMPLPPVWKCGWRRVRHTTRLSLLVTQEVYTALRHWPPEGLRTRAASVTSFGLPRPGGSVKIWLVNCLVFSGRAWLNDAHYKPLLIVSIRRGS